MPGPTSRSLVSLSIGLTLVALAPGQPPSGSTFAKEVDALAAKAGISRDGPGVAVLVIQDGKPLFEKCYGAANLRDKKPITPQTTFELASVSKTFTAMAILLLHERGKLSINDPVRKYIPELPIYDKARPIHLTDLLHHTSGLPDYMDFDEPKGMHPNYLTNEDYSKLFSKLKAKHGPHFVCGEKYEYNNTNFMLLALVVDRVANKSFGLFLRDEFFQPLGMASTFVYENPEVTAKQSAIGYTKDKKGVYKESWGVPPFRHETLLTVGDGAVWTNLEDFALWDAALNAGKIVKPETLKLAFVPSKTRDGKTNDYGLGFTVSGDNGTVTAFGHDGSWAGFNTSYYHSITGNWTTVLLSNRGDFDVDKFWKPLAGLIRARGK